MDTSVSKIFLKNYSDFPFPSGGITDPIDIPIIPNITYIKIERFFNSLVTHPIIKSIKREYFEDKWAALPVPRVINTSFDL